MLVGLTHSECMFILMLGLTEVLMVMSGPEEKIIDIVGTRGVVQSKVMS